MKRPLDYNDLYTLVCAAELTDEKDRSPFLNALVAYWRKFFDTQPSRSVFYHG
jgi:hypothetical protein